MTSSGTVVENENKAFQVLIEFYENANNQDDFEKTNPALSAFVGVTVKNSDTKHKSIDATLHKTRVYKKQTEPLHEHTKENVYEEEPNGKSEKQEEVPGDDSAPPGEEFTPNDDPKTVTTTNNLHPKQTELTTLPAGTTGDHGKTVVTISKHTDITTPMNTVSTTKVTQERKTTIKPSSGGKSTVPKKTTTVKTSTKRPGIPTTTRNQRSTTKAIQQGGDSDPSETLPPTDDDTESGTVPPENGTVPPDNDGTTNTTMQLIGFKWEDFGVYCTFTFFMAGIALSKSIFRRINFLVSRVPEPCMMILLGAIVGGAIHASGIVLAVSTDIDANVNNANVNETAQKTYFTMPAFSTTLFFFVLVPPTVLESAFTLYDHQFLTNIGPIFLFAIFGKLLNAFGIAFSLQFVTKQNLLSPITFSDDPVNPVNNEMNVVNPNYKMNYDDTLIFASIVTGVDASSVLPIFEVTGVNKDLYFILLGESLLNDAVTTSIFFSLVSLKGGDSSRSSEYAKAALAFVSAALGGLIFGVLMGLVTALLTRCSQKCREVEPMIILGCAYLSYVGAELFIFSGSVSVIGCGLVQSHYAFKNISDASLTTTINFSRMLSSMCDSTVFLYLGMHCIFSFIEWHSGLVFYTLVVTFVLRFVVVIFLSGVHNAFGGRRIRMRDQVILAYCGLRGAVCFALANMIDGGMMGLREVFISATIVLILWTIFVQGSTVRLFIEILQIELQSSSAILFEEVNEQVFTMLVSGIEEIADVHNSGFFVRNIKRLDTRFLRNVFLNESVRLDMARVMQEVIEKHRKPIAEVREMHKLRVAGLVDIGRPFLGLSPRVKFEKSEKSDDLLKYRNNSDSPVPDDILLGQPRRSSNVFSYNPEWLEPPPPYRQQSHRPSIGHQHQVDPQLADMDPLELGRTFRIALRDSPFQRMQYRNRRRNMENLDLNMREWPQAMPLSNFDVTDRNLAEVMPRVPLNPEMRWAVPEAILDSELRRRLQLNRIRNIQPAVLPLRNAWSPAYSPHTGNTPVHRRIQTEASRAPSRHSFHQQDGQK